MTTKVRERNYLQLLIDPIRVCAAYRPKFGYTQNESGFDLAKFQSVYQADAFYSWLGLDNPLMYAAHKAAGGMTSVYRQIGIGCEHVFSAVLQDELSLSATDVAWSYEIAATESQKARKLSLDGRIKLADVKDKIARRRIKDWILASASKLDVAPNVANSLVGIVFEIRQGYKSKDAKRQNADIANALTAYTKGYLPSVLVLSNQIDQDIVKRYKEKQWAILTGVLGADDPHVSTYDFMSDVIGYDLAAFFARSSPVLRDEIDKVLKNLLTPEP